MIFFFLRSKSRSAGIPYNVDNMTYPSTGLAPCGRCDAYYTALQTTRGVELHLYQELHQPATTKIKENGSSTNEGLHSADGGFYECIDEDQFSSVTNDNLSDYTEAETALNSANTATLPSKQSLTHTVDPLPFETGPESPSFVIEPACPDRKGSCGSCKAEAPLPFLEPKYFTLEPDGGFRHSTCVENDEHKVEFELSEDEDVKCLSPDDIDRGHITLNGPVSPNVSYCEPPSEDEPLTPTQPDSLDGSPYGYIPPNVGLCAVPDRSGRQTEIITDI